MKINISSVITNPLSVILKKLFSVILILFTTPVILSKSKDLMSLGSELNLLRSFALLRMTSVGKKIGMKTFVTLFFLQACVPSLPEYKNVPKDKISAPNNFTKDATPSKTDSLIKEDWRAFFKDTALISLIETALKNNQDLNILEQEISIANNEVMARQGQYFPKIGIGVGYESEKTSKYTSKGAADETANLPSRINTRDLELSATWEVDIWKKLRNFSKSAYLEYMASIEGKNFAVTQLVVEISSDYYELMSLDNQLEIIDQFIATLQQARQVVQLQQIAGRTTSLAVKRFDAEVLRNQSRKYQIQQQIVTTQNHLNKLLGRLPQDIKRPSDKFIEIKLPEVTSGVPADLLNNRPDLRQASLQLEAAKLNVKAVKAEFYPSLTIDANVGYKSFNAHHFVDPTSFFYNAAGNITAPLLNRNAIKAEYFSANNKQIEAIYTYEQTFINAFAEVSNQLSAVKNFAQVYDLKSQQTSTLAESFEISNMLFKAARVDYLESLLTRRDYLESQLELIEAKQKQLIACVNLYRALGGGWKDNKTQNGKL